MHSFKIGDKVKIPKQKTIGVSYYDFQSSIKDNWEYLIVNSNSFNTVGVVGPNNEHISSNCFNPEDLEPYVEVEFSVGDEVECLGYRYPSTHPAGSNGVVVNIDSKNIISIKANGITNEYSTDSKDIKLIKKANMRTFKKGDVIELVENSYGDLTKGARCTVTSQDSKYVNYILPDGTYGSAFPSRFKLVEERKIIGYKAPYDLFGGEYKKGSIWIKSKAVNSKGDYRPDDKKDTYNAMPQEIVETWEAVYEEPKPKDILVKIADKNTVLVVGKEQIAVQNGREVFFQKDFAYIQKFFNTRATLLGTNGHVVIPQSVKIGCTVITALEFQEIEKAWKQLN